MDSEELAEPEGEEEAGLGGDLRGGGGFCGSGFREESNKKTLRMKGGEAHVAAGVVVQDTETRNTDCEGGGEFLGVG